MSLRPFSLLPICLLGSFLIQTTTVPSQQMISPGKALSLSTVRELAWPESQASPDQTRAQLLKSYGRLPLNFEANLGQTDPQVKFLTRGRGYAVFLTRSGGAVFVLRKPAPKRDTLRPGALVSAAVALESEPASRPTVLRMELVGDKIMPRVDGLDELPGKANYFIGNDPKKWRTNIPTYTRVAYRDVYPGVDLVYRGDQRQLEYDFVVRPGVNPKAIAMQFAGLDRLEVDAQGDLLLRAADEVLHQRKPLIYQEVNGSRRVIIGGYVLRGARKVGFQVGAYDARKPLVIDPVLFFSTYLGGSGFDFGIGMAVDAAGNAYVTGVTESTNFPTTTGAFQTALAGTRDAFVTKLNPTGSGLVYSTYLGRGDRVTGSIAVDAAANAYVTGETDSTSFPTTPGAFQTSFGGGETDGYVTKLNPTGSGLIYSTYLGGNSTDGPFHIALDTAGNAYITGATLSTNFPTTAGALQPALNGPEDGFVAKLNTAGSALVYSTYLGGSGVDFGTGIAVDSSGNAYVTGATNSTNFPTTLGAFQTTFGGGTFPGDAFVTKVNPAGTGLVYSTYLGGSGTDGGGGIALDSLPIPNAYVTGFTQSTNFPTTTGAFQTTFGGGSSDAFVTKLNPLGTGLVYSTYLGGSDSDSGSSIAVDILGDAYVTGTTSSANFPVTSGAFQATFQGLSDAFATKVNPLGSGFFYSTYLGGSGSDFGVGIALDSLPVPNAYVTGATGSTNFPTTPGAFQTAFGGGSFDAFVAKITDIVLPPGATSGKVTGGGSINVVGGIGTFGFIVQAQTTTGVISGDLQYVNHASGANVHSVAFTAFAIVGNTATFSGTCANNGVLCTFNVNVVDNGEPGTNDSFTISIDGGPPEGGTLRSGNIQIH